MNKIPVPATFVADIDITLAPRMMKDLAKKGFIISKPEHTIFAAKGSGVSCTLYSSGKLVVQGKDREAFIEFYLEPEILHTFEATYAELSLPKDAHIGVDESGKGDFFGPLCIAGVFADEQGILKLKKMGVRDSKTLTDSTITKLAIKIRAEFSHHIVKINPQKYNELILQFGNLNKLLAWGHATAIEKLCEQTKCTHVIIDQFADERVVLTALSRKKIKLELTQRHRGEEDLVVAAASILARHTFVDGLQQLSKQFDLELPKGASAKTIAAGRAFVRAYGQENLDKVGKLHFKTLDSILV